MFALCGAALLAAMTAVPVAGQMISGRVIEVGTDRPIPDVEIAAVSTEGNTARVVSDSLGTFLLNLGMPGRYRVTTKHVAYAPGVAEIQLGSDDRYEVVLRLAVEPSQLPALEVVGRSRTPDPALERLGFYERRADGFGVFIGPDEIAKRTAYAPTDYLRSMNGVRVISGGLRGNDVRMTRGEDPNCPPRVIIDRVIMRRGGRFSRPDDPSFDSLVEVASIAAMEVYRSASETPREFGGNDVTCGVILIWTQRGSARR
jgi:hypothetical protein